MQQLKIETEKEMNKTGNWQYTQRLNYKVAVEMKEEKLNFF